MKMRSNSKTPKKKGNRQDGKEPEKLARNTDKGDEGTEPRHGGVRAKDEKGGREKRATSNQREKLRRLRGVTPESTEKRSGLKGARNAEKERNQRKSNGTNVKRIRWGVGEIIPTIAGGGQRRRD